MLPENECSDAQQNDEQTKSDSTQHTALCVWALL